MNKGIRLVLAMGLAVLGPSAVWAEGETEAGQLSSAVSDSPVSSEPSAKKEPSAEEVQQMMGNMMAPMADMMGLMLEGMAKTMAKPQIAEHFATFTRNYYDALIARGFTEEEAMKIVTSSGLPSMGGQQ